MWKYSLTLVICLTSAVSARSDDDYDLAELESEAGDARLFFANFTSSLVQVNSTLLAYALVGLAIAGAAGLALYYLYLQSASSGGYGQYSQYGYNQYSYQSRYHFKNIINNKLKEMEGEDVLILFGYNIFWIISYNFDDDWKHCNYYLENSK